MPTPTDQLYQKFRDNLNHSHQEVIIKFFLSFSRFEFLLKFNDFVTAEGLVNWDDFTKNCKTKYVAWQDKGLKQELENAIQYIQSNPPKKLIKNDGQYIWQDIIRTNIDRLEILTLNIRTIRNNLFHGNKSLNADNGRDKELLESSLLILDDLICFLNGELDFVEESI